MNILCAICQDTLEPSNDIFITPCGHVFHFPCLIQWLEKAHNCPQCRQRVIRDKLVRIYFNFSNSEDVKEDSFTLQQKIDTLSFQIKLKETELKTCNKENATLKKQISGLREEVKRVESEVKGKQAAIRALTAETKHLQERGRDYEKLKQEKDKLEQKLVTYQNVKDLICGSEHYVDRLLHGNNDVPTLLTYLSVMKKELCDCLGKRKELRESVRVLQQELQTVKKNRNSLATDYLKRIELLEEELATSKSENDMLQKQLFDLKNKNNQSNDATTETSESSSASCNTERDTGIDLDSAKSIKRKAAPEKQKSSLTLADESDIVFVSPVPIKKTKGNEENSPYLPTKSKSVLSLKERDSQHSGFSLAAKRNVLSSKKPTLSFKNSGRKNNDIVFDGFGGHSKIETFPLPKSSPSKLKRPTSDYSKNKKIKLDLGNNRQLDDFIINLT